MRSEGEGDGVERGTEWVGEAMGMGIGILDLAVGEVFGASVVVVLARGL